MTPEQMRRAALLLDSLATVIDPREPCALARLLREQADAMEWRPIETAPRDGTVLLIWSDDDQQEFGFFEYGRWYAINNGDYIDGGYGRPYERTPTHWQPLPPPPEGGK